MQPKDSSDDADSRCRLILMHERQALFRTTSDSSALDDNTQIKVEHFQRNNGEFELAIRRQVCHTKRAKLLPLGYHWLATLWCYLST